MLMRHIGHSSTSLPPYRPKINVSQHNTYESRRGSHVVLEFADPTSCTPSHSPELSRQSSGTASSYTTSLVASRQASSRAASRMKLVKMMPTPTSSPQPVVAAEEPYVTLRPAEVTPTRLQMTFDAIKKMSGMRSPRSDIAGAKEKLNSQCPSLCEEEEEEEEAVPEGSTGYFSVVDCEIEEQRETGEAQ